MHYYPRKLGDYSTATTHLSMLEHGAFTKLLDYYYSTEKPIPPDRCERIAGAYETHEREAVSSVLEQFFLLSDQGWINVKADEVIAQFRDKSLKAKESAGRRWKRTECEGNANAYANAMLTQNSKPITQKKDQKQKTCSPKGSRLPPDWSLPTDWGTWAIAERPAVDLAREAAIFADHWHSTTKNAVKTDWFAAWRNWIRRNLNGDGGSSNAKSRKLSAAEQTRSNALARELAERRQAYNGSGHADAMGSDGGDLRPPLDGEFRLGP